MTDKTKFNIARYMSYIDMFTWIKKLTGQQELNSNQPLL